MKRFNLDIDTEDDKKTTPTKSPRITGSRFTPSKGGPSPLNKIKQQMKDGDKSPTQAIQPSSKYMSRIQATGASPLNAIKDAQQIAQLPTPGRFNFANTEDDIRRPSLALSVLVSSSNAVLIKTPNAKDLWKKLNDGSSSSNSSDFGANQIITEQAECQMFEMDGPDIDFDAINDNESESIDPKREHPYTTVEDLIDGHDIFTDEVSTQQAYTKFSQIQAAEQASSSSLIVDEDELPSHKLQRLTKELEEIQSELLGLEKTELPTALEHDDYSAMVQLQTVRDLKGQVNQLKPVSDEVSTKVQGKDLDITAELGKIVQFKNHPITAEESVNLEIYVNIAEQNEQKGLNKLFKELKGEVDQCQSNIGPNTLGKNIYQLVTDISKQITQTRDYKLLNDRGTLLSESLDQFTKRFDKQTQDQTKIDYLYKVTEKSIEQNGYLYMILDRFKVIESMYQQAPNMQAQLQQITQQSLKLPTLLQRESDQISMTKQVLRQAVSDVQTIFNNQ